MFVAFEKEDESVRFSERLRNYFTAPQIELKKVEVPCALPFYIIRTREWRGEYPWETAAEAAGTLRARSLLPFWASPGKDVPLSPFRPLVFPRRLLFNSAVKTIEKMLLDPRKVSVTLIDNGAYLVDLVEELVFFAARLSIVTDCAAPYEELAARLLKKYGVSLFISPRLQKDAVNSTFIISDKIFPVPLSFSGVLFTNEKKRLENAVVIVGEGFTLPEKYSSLLPQDADALSFAGALYELCAANELGCLRYDKMIACG